MTDLSSVSGLRGVREWGATMRQELLEILRRWNHDDDYTVEAVYVDVRRLLSLPPPSPQARNQDYKSDLHADLRDFDQAVAYVRACAIEGALDIALRDVLEAHGVTAPAGTQGQVQARPQMSIGKNAAGEMHLSASGYCSACNMLVEFGTDDCPHAKTMYGRAVLPADVSSQAGQAPSEDDTECAARDYGFQCTLDKNHDGPHKAHGFERVVHEWAAVPSAGSGQEGLREAINKLCAAISRIRWAITGHVPSKLLDAIMDAVQLQIAAEPLLPPAPIHGDAEPLCANCGHSYAQHSKGIDHPQKYCRHCPCLEWTLPPASKPTAEGE